MAGAVVGAVISGTLAGVGAAGGVTVLGVALTAVEFGILTGVATLALGFLQQALTPKPKLPDLSGFDTRGSGAGRTQQIQQAITPWDIPYGEVRKSGPLVYAETTNKNRFLHLVIILASCQITEINPVIFDDEAVYDDELDGNNIVNAGRYNNVIRINKHLGATDQSADSDLVSAVSDWTNDHRLRGRAYIYVRLRYNKNKFPSGVPNISAWVKGKKYEDVRESGNPSVFGSNPALILNDYWQTSRKNGGPGFLESEIDLDSIDSEADVCDEIVTTKESMFIIKSVDDGNDSFVLDDQVLKLQTGDRCNFATTGTLPTGISAGTDYYVIVVRRVKSQSSDVEFQVASSFSNAQDGTAVTLSSTGSGNLTVTKDGEPRYTANGVIETSRKHGDVIDELLASMAGNAVNTGGKWYLTAGRYISPTISFDEDDDVIGQITTKPHHDIREYFNGVKGVFAPVDTKGVPTDYPVVQDSAALSRDNDNDAFLELDLPFTSRSNTAQRIARVVLNEHLEEITYEALFKLSALKVKAGDNIQLSSTTKGWSNKVFRIIDWTPTTIRGEGDSPSMGVSMIFREISSGVYSYDASAEEQTFVPAANTNLPDIYTVEAASDLTITEELYSTREGGGVKARANVSWTASEDDFAENYQVSYKLTTESEYTFLPLTKNTSDVINDIDEGTYDFRLLTLNIYGVESGFITKTQEIVALGAAPTQPQNLTINAIGGLTLLRWTKSTDLDVRQGGTVEIRHDKNLSGAALSTSVTISEPVDGAATEALVPLKEGTYIVRFIDSSGTPSPITTVSSEQVTILEYTNLSTISEHSTFPGTHSNTVAIDGVLKLVGTNTMDQWTNVDDVENWDAGDGGITASGTYTFSAGFDFGSVVRKRLTTQLTVAMVLPTDNIDSRTEDIDDWADFDGAPDATGDAVVFVRYTDDDPNDSAPDWSEYQRLEASEFEARAFEFKVELSTDDTAYNIEVSELTIRAENLA